MRPSSAGIDTNAACARNASAHVELEEVTTRKDAMCSRARRLVSPEGSYLGARPGPDAKPEAFKVPGEERLRALRVTLLVLCLDPFVSGDCAMGRRLCATPLD